MIGLLKLSLMLLLAALLSGCGQSIAGTVNPAIVCKRETFWPEQTVSKDDKLTDETAKRMERSNVGRKAFCK